MVQSRVLVVDGSDTVGETVATLEAAECSVVVAGTLSESLEKLRQQRIDIVVTEYELPDGDGLELLKEVRSIYESVPVLMYTAHGSERVASDAIETGVDSYLPKGRQGATERLQEAVEDATATNALSGGFDEVPPPELETIIRAVDEAPVGITISDPSLPDNPIVYLNDAYEELTGYGREWVLGRNCRFLQGPDTEEEPVRQMREAVEEREPVQVEVLNYREDGTPFWNQVTIAPIFDEQDELSHFVGFQNDVTERKEAEAMAQRRATSLREERQALERVLGRLSGLVNQISHVLVNAEKREEIEEQVCAEIAATGGYTHAWIGEPGATGSTMTVRVNDGSQGQLMEAGTRTEWEGTILQEALDQGTIKISSEAEDLPPGVDPGTFGAVSMAAVPLIYRRTNYGVLGVYAEQSGTLDRRECKVLEAIGQMIASGINAVETKQVLTGDRVTELGFEVADSSFPLIELARATDAGITYEGSTLSDDGSLRLFLTIADSVEEFDALVGGCSSITDGFVIARQNGTVAASIQLAEGSAFRELGEYGATIRDISLSSSSQTVQLHVDIPVEGDIRSVLSVLESTWDGVTLVRQRERKREPRPTAEFTSTVQERLTDRQYTAIETAYLSDYFDFPRPVSGEDLASSMDISRQTYHQHLRAAQRKLLDEFFDAE